MNSFLLQCKSVKSFLLQYNTVISFPLQYNAMNSFFLSHSGKCVWFLNKMPMITQKTHIIDLFPGAFSASGKSPGFSFAKNKAIVYLGRIFELVLE